MKKVIAVIFVLGLLLSPPSTMLSQQKGFGAGIILGEPTGFSLKGWLNETNAIDAGVAWSFGSPASFHVHADYLWHNYDVIKSTEILPLYYGFGARLKAGENGEDTRFGIRAVIGLDYIFRNAPVDLFLEVAPIVDIAPKTELSGNGGIGARFWFR